MHNDPADVLQHIQKDCVPSDYGGCGKSIQELGGTRSTIKYNKLLCD